MLDKTEAGKGQHQSATIELFRKEKFVFSRARLPKYFKRAGVAGGTTGLESLAFPWGGLLSHC